MRRLVASFHICVAVLLLVAFSPTAIAADLQGGMLSWPRAEMAQALSIYLSKRMGEEDVPGLAIAVVADGQIVFEQGYGTADLMGEIPVTANTLFEAASLGKPVVAMGALALVAEGKLSLDEPLGSTLEEPWLGDGDDHELISLRHVLTHTSGLTNFVWCCSNESWTTPGDVFSYSGVGYMYLGHVMGQASDMSFDRFMRTRVLAPLGMASSGYALAEPLVPTVARGFAPLSHPLLVFFVPLALLFVAFSLVSVLVVRFGLNRLKLFATDFVAGAGLSLIITICLIGLILGFWGLLFILAYVIAFSVALFLGSLVVLVAFAFLGLLGPADGTLRPGGTHGGGGTSPFMTAIAVMLVFAGSYFFIGQNVPVPAMSGEVVNPAYSLRASAHDLGLFLEGFIEGEVMGVGLRDQSLSQSVDIGGGIGWGLGLGVRDGATGRTGWQWGSNPGFESIMVVDARRRAGIIVLTNSSKAGLLVQEIAGHVMGEEPGWRVP